MKTTNKIILTIAVATMMTTASWGACSTDLDMGGNKVINLSAPYTDGATLPNTNLPNIAWVKSYVAEHGGGSGQPNTVTGAAGLTWLDRNLGAIQVATSSTDYLSYGDLFQWGRFSDGHENITWTNSTTGTGGSTTATKADNPGHSNFIASSSDDWRVNSDDTLWTGTAAANNPCPTGFRLPTETELKAEVNAWSSKNSAGAFDSNLKLPLPGYRANSEEGPLGLVSTHGFYWTSTASNGKAMILRIDADGASWFSSSRAKGYSVRCVQD